MGQRSLRRSLPPPESTASSKAVPPITRRTGRCCRVGRWQGRAPGPVPVVPQQIAAARDQPVGRVAWCSFLSILSRSPGDEDAGQRQRAADHLRRRHRLAEDQIGQESRLDGLGAAAQPMRKRRQVRQAKVINPCPPTCENSANLSKTSQPPRRAGTAPPQRAGLPAAAPCRKPGRSRP